MIYTGISIFVKLTLNELERYISAGSIVMSAEICRRWHNKGKPQQPAGWWDRRFFEVLAKARKIRSMCTKEQWLQAIEMITKVGAYKAENFSALYVTSTQPQPTLAKVEPEVKAQPKKVKATKVAKKNTTKRTLSPSINWTKQQLLDYIRKHP